MKAKIESFHEEKGHFSRYVPRTCTAGKSRQQNRLYPTPTRGAPRDILKEHILLYERCPFTVQKSTFYNAKEHLLEWAESRLASAWILPYSALTESAEQQQQQTAQKAKKSEKQHTDASAINRKTCNGRLAERLKTATGNRRPSTAEAVSNNINKVSAQAIITGADNAKEQQ